MIDSIDKVKKELLKSFTIRKLYNRTGGKHMYYLFEFFLNELKAGNIKDDVDDRFLLDQFSGTHSFSLTASNEKHAKTLIQKEVDQSYLLQLLETCIDSKYFTFRDADSTFHGNLSDEIWLRLTDETKLTFSKNVSVSNMWHSTNVNNNLFYLYQKGFINFTETKKKYNINRLYDVPNLTVAFLKRVEVNYTDDIIKKMINVGGKQIKHKIEYLFTIPSLRRKFIRDKKWMMMPIENNSGKMIDAYPEKEQLKYIAKLKSKIKSGCK